MRDEVIQGVEFERSLRTELQDTPVFKCQGDEDRLAKEGEKWPVAQEKNQEGMVPWKLSEESVSGLASVGCYSSLNEIGIQN